MVNIKPFKGYTYFQDEVDRPSDLVAPPYDVISPAAQEKFYGIHPHNIIRIVLGKTYPKDTDISNCYTRAKEYFDDFVSKGVLVQNEKPAFYIYLQEFKVNSKKFRRTGLICRVKIEDYRSKVILPHEATLNKPKVDRFNLIKSTGLNLCPIFGLYEDPGLKIEKFLNKLTIFDPLMTFTDDFQITHTLWKTEIGSEVQEIERIFQNKQVLIADGHHRYEVALQYKKYLHETNPQAPEASDYTLICLTGMEDPGLVILPIHRLVNNISAAHIEEFEKKLAADFIIEKIQPEETPAATAGRLEKILAEKGTRGTSLAVVLKNIREILILTLKKGIVRGDNRLEALDVSVLHNLVFKKILQLPPEKNEENIKYSHDTQKVLEEVSAGQFEAGFILNPTKINEIKDIAFSGTIMPQKSTFFYPKLLSGLVINKIE